MKTSLTKLKSSLGLALLLSMPVWAKPVAQVTELSGTVFAVGEDGKTKTLKVNDHIDEKSDLMVEEGGNLSLNDYYDATYHLAGGSNMKFFNRSVQLKKGKVWIEAKNPKNTLVLTTANGSVNYAKAEFIATFDQMTSRSQFLVVKDSVDVANILDKNLMTSVTSGTFTLIDPEVENGSPRAATKVGLASLQSALAEFKRLPPASEPTREIASVEETPAPVKKGEIMFISSGRLPASVEGGAYKYWKKSAGKKMKTTSVQTFAGAPIKYYGTNFQAVTPVSPRVPASVAPVQIIKKTPISLNQDPEFEGSLKKEMTQQPKYSKELNSLIQDLTSY